MSNQASRKLAKLTRRALLVSLLCNATVARSEVIDLPTAPLDSHMVATFGPTAALPQRVTAALPQRVTAALPQRVTAAQPQGIALQPPPPPGDQPAPRSNVATPRSEPLSRDQLQAPVRELPDNEASPSDRTAPPNVGGEATSPQTEPAPLNFDPNADINDLVPPAPPVAPPPPPPPNLGARRPVLGAAAGGFSASPTMIGDLFGGGLSTFTGTQQVFFSGYSPGTILTGGPGQSSSQLAFEFGGDLVPDDILTSGSGLDLAGGDGFADTFNLAEPLPPNGALTSPGPGFIFDGGTAVYVNGNGGATTPQPGAYQDGQPWYISYSYSQTLLGGAGDGRPVPTPGVSVRRIKLSENFSPEVRDRCFGSYNFFNDAYGGLGDVSRYTLGVERILVDRLFSVEARLLMAGTYGSTQDVLRPESRDFELGNAAFIGKAVLLRNENMLWSAGCGFTIPSADTTRVKRGGEDILVIKNRTFHLLPFSALLLRLSPDTFFQTYMQLDVAANGDPIYGNLAGGPLPKLGVFNDSTLMNLDFALNHVMYRSQCRRLLRQVIGNAEIHYSGTLQEADVVDNNGLRYTNLKRYFNVLNATAGVHLVLGDNLVVTPAMSIPLRDGLDEQYDYEAIVQVNYLH